MSNEELVRLIQGGERDKLVELWAQVRRMAMKEAEERMQQERLHAALRAAIVTLPPNLQAVIWRHYFCGETVDANAHSKALRMLRAPKCSRALRVYL